VVNPTYSLFTICEKISATCLANPERSELLFTVLSVMVAFLSREIPNIEGLTGLDQLVGEKNAVFVGFPLKVQGASGGMMRAVALVY